MAGSVYRGDFPTGDIQYPGKYFSIENIDDISGDRKTVHLPLPDPFENFFLNGGFLPSFE